MTAKETWRGYALAITSSFLVTTAVGWFAVAKSIPSEAEIRILARAESPYSVDKAAIQDSLQILLALNEDTNDKLDRLDERLRKLEASLAAIERELSLQRRP